MNVATTPDDTACDMRFGQVGLACVRVRQTDAAAIFGELERRVQAAPQMFARTAVVVDLSHLSALPDDGTVDALMEAVRSAGMLPVGLAYGDSDTEALSQRMGLPLIAGFREAFERTGVTASPPTPAAETAPVAEAPPAAAGMHHVGNVRSGQQIYARDRDLIITATVANGAEVIADGSIHVYGTLRGRALAGAQGDQQARVFCTDFRPQLVSIAGHYRVFEEIPAQWTRGTMQCRLEGEKLLVENL